MKRIYLLVGLALLPGAARADFADSGNLTIGSQAVIGGTMTVQGSAFSVGGSTFVVAAGSVTLGGRLNAAAAGIKWADGSTSTTAAGGGGAGTIVGTAAPYLGINYVLWSASGAAVAYSTGTSSFHVAAATVVFEGTEYTTPDTFFGIGKSTYSIVYWNPTNGFRQFGLKDFMPPTISSYTKQLADDLAIALSSSDAKGNVYLFKTAWRLPNAGALEAVSQRDLTTAFSSPNIYPAYNCSGVTLETCLIPAMHATITDPDMIEMRLNSSVQVQGMRAWVLNNPTGSAATLKVTSSGDSWVWYSVNGGAGTTITTSSPFVATSISIPSGYSTLIIYAGYNGGGGSFAFAVTGQLPAGVNIVRGGYW